LIDGSEEMCHVGIVGWSLFLPCEKLNYYRIITFLFTYLAKVILLEKGETRLGDF